MCKARGSENPVKTAESTGQKPDLNPSNCPLKFPGVSCESLSFSPILLMGKPPLAAHSAGLSNSRIDPIKSWLDRVGWSCSPKWPNSCTDSVRSDLPFWVSFRSDTQSVQSSLTGKLSKEADPSPAHVRSCIHGSSAEKALPQCVRSPFQHFGGYRSVKMLRRSKI